MLNVEFYNMLQVDIFVKKYNLNFCSYLS